MNRPGQAKILEDMLTKNKKVLVTSNLHEQIRMQKTRLRLRKMFCPFCEIETEMLPLDSAVTVSGISSRRLIEIAEQSEIHMIETTSGHLLFCRESLRCFFCQIKRIGQ